MAPLIPAAWTVVIVAIGNQQHMLPPRPVPTPLGCDIEAEAQWAEYHARFPAAQLVKFGCSRERQVEL